MRPVHRGAPPFVFRRYQQAREPLAERLGPYCSYCERRINNLLAVEHICPKMEFPHLKLEWSNFLFACSNCNSIKRQQQVAGRTNYYWSDVDNTARAFQYQGGLITINSELTPEQQTTASRTLILTGLERCPGFSEPSPNDKRWQERQEVWDIAKALRQDLFIYDSPTTRQNIILIARSSGFWSVWMTVFAGDVDMRRRLVEAFPGTCQDCFDTETKPLPRPGGSL